MLTCIGYYHGSTVVPVVVPVFFPSWYVGCLRNFLYELNLGQSLDVKPESGGTCGPKDSPKALLGRPWGRGARGPQPLFFRLFFAYRIYWWFLFVFFSYVIALLLSFVWRPSLALFVPV